MGVKQAEQHQQCGNAVAILLQQHMLTAGCTEPCSDTFIPLMYPRFQPMGKTTQGTPLLVVCVPHCVTTQGAPLLMVCETQRHMLTS